MLLNDVYYVCVKTAIHHIASKQLKISFDTTRPISSAHRNGQHIQQI